MGANLKKVLLNVVYYSLIGVMVAFVIFFLISLTNASMAMWERVAYYVLIISLVLVVVYDIICTCLKTQKYISGFILYGITLGVVVISLIVLALNSADGRLFLDISERFFRLILISWIINALAVLIYCTGEKLVVNISNRMKK